MYHGLMLVPTQGRLLGPGSGILFLGWTSYIFTATGPPDGLGASTTSMGHPGLPESRHYCGIPVNHTHDMVVADRLSLLGGQTMRPVRVVRGTEHNGGGAPMSSR